MPSYLALCLSRCEVRGEPTGSVDIQVLYIEASSAERAEALISGRERETYTNEHNEIVSWPVQRILSIEEFQSPSSGDELVGFITTPAELASYAGT